MTNDYIENTCGLHNGVRFEELRVDTFYEDKTPKKYRVILSFEGHLKDTIYNKQIDRIYFNRPNGIYHWHVDTMTNGLYYKWGQHRERIDAEHSLTKLAEKIDSTPQFTCPISFKPDTWYFLNFYNPECQAYLYVDKSMNYKIEKINLSTNF
jgi:hypothetical protein